MTNGICQISAVIITLNAAEHLDACLSALSACDEVLIVDSGSTDATLAIATKHGAKVLSRDFDGYGPQKRFAVGEAKHDWILSVDADEVLDEDAQTALRTLQLDDATQCWRLRRRTYVGQREVRYGHWHPDRLVRLFNRQHTNVTDDIVHEHIPSTGKQSDLPGSIKHYSFADLADIIRLNLHRRKAVKYLNKGRHAGSPTLLFRAAWAFFRSYILRQGFRDGQAGVMVALSASVNAVLGLAMASWHTPEELEIRQ